MMPASGAWTTVPIPVNGQLLDHQVPSVRWMLQREMEGRTGGILADDMGLGKTYQITALLKAHAVDTRRSTLIVTVVSTVQQWQDVLMQFGGIRAFVLVAGQDFVLPTDLDVVLTTYSVFQQRNVPSCLRKRNWQRIVLDEGHVIRNAVSCVNKQLTALIRPDQFRWIVSGTPVQNCQSELQTLLTWVGCREGKAAREACVFRRTIPQVSKHFPKIELPPIVTRIKYLFFRYPEERTLYFNLTPPDQRRCVVPEATARNQKRQQSHQNSLQSLMRQRQMCVHPRILMQEEGGSLQVPSQLPAAPEPPGLDAKCCEQDPVYSQFAISGRTEGELFEIQCEELARIRGESCAHGFEAMPLLHLDRLRVGCSDLSDQTHRGRAGPASPPSSDDDDFPDASAWNDASKRAVLMEFSSTTQQTGEEMYSRSTKLDYLCAKLMADFVAGRKALVFCQWKIEMKLIGDRLQTTGIGFLRLDGDQKPCQRRCVLYNFDQPGVCVLLIQIRAGGVGLNLQAATRVYITSPDWNPVNELQAIARAHRLGQKNAVKCTRIVMAGTVEEVNCLTTANVKLAMINQCLRDDDFAGRRMGVVNEKYGAQVARVCTHYAMLEQLRQCDI